MKKLILLLLLIASISIVHSQSSSTIQVNGKSIIGVCGDSILLRGINYSPFNWGWNFGDEKFSQIALTGANCVRIPWYTSSSTGGGAPLYNSISNLDSAITRCIRNKMIPIIELHDNTCNSSLSKLVTLSNWYLQAGVLSIINQHKSSLIINIANEAGYVQWTSNPATALTNYSVTYQNIVSNLRTAGITVPLMIDAPDCGTGLDDLVSIGSALQTADPIHNLIFSAHTYWYNYARNDSLKMRNKIINALSKNIPIVLGEVANLQDDTSPCQYNLNYKQLLKICQELKVSWLAWGWDHDICSNRQLSSDGNYAHLTSYGNDIVNNPIYGIKLHSTRTSNLVYGQCISNSETSEISDSDNISIYPNPFSTVLNIKSDNSTEDYTVEIMNNLGQVVLNNKINLIRGATEQLNLKNQISGIYFLKLQSSKKTQVKKIIKQLHVANN